MFYYLKDLLGKDRRVWSRYFEVILCFEYFKLMVILLSVRDGGFVMYFMFNFVL